MGPDLCVVIPTYEHFDFAARAMLSLFRTTPGAMGLVVDDASPSWQPGGNGPGSMPLPLRRVAEEFSRNSKFIRLNDNGGLTRAWNTGLLVATTVEAGFTVLTNSDVVFTPHWWEPLAHALVNGYDLVGPLSNAPGDTAGDLQYVGRYLEDYFLTDEEGYLAYAAGRLGAAALPPIPARPNGFCMAARTTTWWRNSFNKVSVFRPYNAHYINGRRNPTPLMSGQEDEFQQRLIGAGGKTAVVPGSLVFHYRSVSRGDRYKKGHWYRPEGQTL